MVYIPPDEVWIVVVGFIIGFILALGIGANDVANTFGTSVGSKVLTLKQACILASIFETAGAVLLGAKVSDTVRKGILNVDVYQNETELFMVGNVAALGGSCVWMFVATALKLPVSATHSIIGAILGFTLVAKGADGVSWKTLGAIVVSWFVSPVMSGLVSTAIFFICKIFILTKEDPLEPGLRFMPLFYAFTIVINVFSIFYDGPELLGFDRIPLWGTFLLAFGTGTVVGLLVRIFMVPWQRAKIIEEVQIMKAQELQEAAYKSIQPESKYERDENGDLVIRNEEYETKAQNGKVNMGYDNEEKSGASDDTYAEIQEGKSDVVKHKIFVLSSESFDDEEPEKQATPNGTTTELPLSINNISDDTKAQNGYLHELSKGEIEKGLDGEEKPVHSMAADNQDIKDRPETARLFSFLQILTAIFGAFAHGGNDVSNAIGPVVSIWLVATTGSIEAQAATPVWILLMGGAGISIGLWIWGRRVIETMGEDLSVVTPSSGFCIEIGSATTVLVASNIGLPISSTHCKVGSIVFVGRFRSKTNVDWRLFRNIVAAWILTLPAAGCVSAAFMALLQLTVT